MAKRLTVEQQIAELAPLAEAPVDEEGLVQLRAALASKQNLVIARAAEIAMAQKLRQLQPDMEAAFARLLIDPTKSDKACVGKVALARSLQTLELPAEAVYLPGIRHVQKEAIWGGESDTAAPLRGLCAFGLVQMGSARVMPLLVDLLADPIAEARVAAVQSLAATGQDSASLLLRLKVLCGDSELGVIAECLHGLMRLAPAGGVEFVAGFLAHPDASLAESAAVALGESRSDEALAVLVRYYREKLTRASRRIVLQAIALLRKPEAIQFLTQVVQEDDVPSALHALEAMSLYRRDEPVRARLQAIVRARHEPELADAFHEWAERP